MELHLSKTVYLHLFYADWSVRSGGLSSRDRLPFVT